MPALHVGRRHLLAGMTAAFVPRHAVAQGHRYRVAFANINETAGARIEGLGFSGADVRRSFELAARTLPLDMIYYDNAGDPNRALENTTDAVRRKVDLLIMYNAEASTNPAIAQAMKAAGIPLLTISHPAGDAPLYIADHVGAGRIAGRALGAFAKQTWPDEMPLAVMIGDIGDPSDVVSMRIGGITEGLREQIPTVTITPLDTGGQALRAEGVLAKYLTEQPRRKILIASLDDPTTLSARTGVEFVRRLQDCVIVSQGLDRSIHGGASEKKEIDPTNRASVVLGSVAYFLDRYGYEVLPLAMRMLKGETVPPRTLTQHMLVTSANVFREYPPTDMN